MFYLNINQKSGSNRYSYWSASLRKALWWHILLERLLYASVAEDERWRSDAGISLLPVLLQPPEHRCTAALTGPGIVTCCWDTLLPRLEIWPRDQHIFRLGTKPKNENYRTHWNTSVQTKRFVSDVHGALGLCPPTVGHRAAISYFKDQILSLLRG